MNHYGHNVYADKEPLYCSDCEVYLADDGTELSADTLEQDWTNTENLLSTY